MANDFTADCHALGAMHPTRASLEASWLTNKSKSASVLRFWTTKKSRLFKSSRNKVDGKRVFTFDGKLVIWADELESLQSPIPSLAQRLDKDDQKLMLSTRRSISKALKIYLEGYCVVGTQGVREQLMARWRAKHMVDERNEECQKLIRKLKVALTNALTSPEEEDDDDVEEELLGEVGIDNATSEETTGASSETANDAMNPAKMLCEFALDTFRHVNEFSKVAAKQRRETTQSNKSAHNVALASLIEMETRIRTAKDQLLNPQNFDNSIDVVACPSHTNNPSADTSTPVRNISSSLTSDIYIKRISAAEAFESCADVIKGAITDGTLLEVRGKVIRRQLSDAGVKLGVPKSVMNVVLGAQREYFHQVPPGSTSRRVAASTVIRQSTRNNSNNNNNNNMNMNNNVNKSGSAATAARAIQNRNNLMMSADDGNVDGSGVLSGSLGPSFGSMTGIGSIGHLAGVGGIASLGGVGMGGIGVNESESEDSSDSELDEGEDEEDDDGEEEEDDEGMHHIHHARSANQKRRRV